MNIGFSLFRRLHWKSCLELEIRKGSIGAKWYRSIGFLVTVVYAAAVVVFEKPV